jgi:hypothetical protein
MADYRLHPITWKNVIDYNDYDYKLRLPHVCSGGCLHILRGMSYAHCWRPYYDWNVEQ